MNQPSREKLNSIIKHEIEKSDGPNEVSFIYNELYEGILHYLASPEGKYITKNNAEKHFKHINKSLHA